MNVVNAQQISSLESEQSVLGSFLINNDSYFDHESVLTIADFYSKEHQKIYAAIQLLVDQGKAFDYLMVAESIKQNHQKDFQDILAYLMDLVGQTPEYLNIKNYIQIIKNYSLVRQLHTVLRDIYEKTLSKKDFSEITDVVDYAEQQVMSLRMNQSSEHTFQSVASLVSGVFDEIHELESSKELPGIKSGFADLDAMTLGFQPGDMVIIAGRPSMGKTAFAMNIAEYVAYKLDRCVAVFSLEMSSSQLIYRLLGSMSGISSQQIRQGKIPEKGGWDKLNTAFDQLLKNKKLFINDQIPITPGILRTQCRRFKKDHPDLGLILIDYLQLIYPEQSRNNRHEEITQISHALKSIAKELGVPILVLSQLSRSVEGRQDKRPIMSDLRESGSIEQDADVIMMIYRDEVYNKENGEKNVAEINIVKQRNGPIGGVKLHFDSARIKFSNKASSNFYNLEETFAKVKANEPVYLPEPVDAQGKEIINKIRINETQKDLIVWSQLIEETSTRMQELSQEKAEAFASKRIDLVSKQYEFYRNVLEILNQITNMN